MELAIVWLAGPLVITVANGFFMSWTGPSSAHFARVIWCASCWLGLRWRFLLNFAHGAHRRSDATPFALSPVPMRKSSENKVRLVLHDRNKMSLKSISKVCVRFTDFRRIVRMNWIIGRMPLVVIEDVV